MSFFPEKDGDVFPLGQAYTLPFDVKDGKRHETLVRLDSMERAKKLMPDVGFEDLEGKPWYVSLPYLILQSRPDLAGGNGLFSRESKRLLRMM
jgi:hypothetical protein